MGSQPLKKNCQIIPFIKFNLKIGNFETGSKLLRLHLRSAANSHILKNWCLEISMCIG